MSKLDLNVKPRRNRLIWRQEAEDQYLVYDPATDRIYMFTSFGQRLLTLCDGDHTVKQIIEFVSSELGLPFDTVKERVLKFISELEYKGIIKLT